MDGVTYIHIFTGDWVQSRPLMILKPFFIFLAIFSNFKLTVQIMGETKSANFLIFMLHNKKADT